MALGKEIKRNFATLWVALPLVASASEKFSTDEALRNYFELFQKGAYSHALEKLQNLNSKQRMEPKVKYWEAVAQTKLQRFDLAAPLLANVVSDQGKSTEAFLDSAYLLGQSYYATKRYKSAEDAFRISLERGYKPGASLYYLGYVQNLIGKDQASIVTFKKIMSLPKSEDEFVQPAAFQIAEVSFEVTSQMPQKTSDDKIKKKKAYIDNLIPMYERTIALNKTSDLATQAKTRIAGIKALYGIKPPPQNVTESGAAKPVSPWVIRVSQDFKYDTNLTNQSTGKLEPVSYTGAVQMKSSVFSKYESITKNWIVITPEVSYDYTYHSNRTDPVIYQYDATSLSPAIRIRLDHKFKKKIAAGLFEYEYNYGTQDHLKIKHQLFKSSYHNLVFGERFEILNPGTTTFKFSYKWLRNKSRAADYVAPKWTWIQNFSIGGYTLASTLSYEKQIARDVSNDTNTFSLNNSIGFPKIYWNSNIDLAWNFTLTDPVVARPTRGLEKTINPSVTITKELSKMFTVNLNYAYTMNISRDKENYDYRKSVWGVGGQATF